MLTPPVGTSRVTEALCLWAVNAKCDQKALGQCLRLLHYTDRSTTGYVLDPFFSAPQSSAHV